MNHSRPSFMQLHSLCWVALTSALISAGALLTIPFGTVPVTLQDLFVTLAGFILGPKRGAYAVALYILAGAAGLPVFSGGRGGLGHLLGPTGGYLFGFLLLAIFAGFGSTLATHKHTLPAAGFRKNLGFVLMAFIPALLGLGLLYTCGALWLAHVLQVSLAKATAIGVIPFLPIGLCKVILAVFLWQYLYRKRLLPA